VTPVRRVVRWAPGLNWPTAELGAAILVLTWALAGRLIGGAIMSLSLSKGSPSGPGSGSGSENASAGPRSGGDPPPVDGGEGREIRRPDGTVLYAECFGPADAPPVVLTHGWGANRLVWGYAREALAGRFRVVVWDLRGLGRSSKPDNHDFSLDAMAADLDAVLDATTGGRPAVVVGHSIGGMTVLTYCRLFPGALGPKVAGLALVHTTYTDPVRTTRGASVYSALEKPVLVPLCYLTIALWPLVWLMNWLSYLNGSVHRSTHKQSFAGTETRGQLDLVARLLPHARPDVLARGMLGMIRYDATATLATIGVPVAVVEGDLDTTTPPEASRFMAGSIPRSELVTLAPARHMGILERHAHFDRAVETLASNCLHSHVPG
jgi:pimeloyl-ACP methyl ester carboxylesterase